MRLDNLASCIEDLRRIEDENPSTAISNAITYLSIFLEKLCTKEIIFERTPYSSLRMNIVVHPEMLGRDIFQGTALIKATMEWNLVQALQNYEAAYGYEPVTLRDLQGRYFDATFIRKEADLDQQATLYGYKLYKKDTDKNRFISNRMAEYQPPDKELDELQRYILEHLKAGAEDDEEE